MCDSAVTLGELVFVSYGYVYSNDKTSTYYVRCVR